MLLLCETAQGFALCKLKNKSLVDASVDDIQNIDSSEQLFKLKSFKKFPNLKIATSELVSLQEGVAGEVLKSFLAKKTKSKTLLVNDKQLAADLKKNCGLNIKFSSSTQEIFRLLKSQIDKLLDLSPESANALSFSLGHSLAHYRIKYSPEKVDIMVTQAAGLLEDLDKELNNLVMRLREWYGFHFPELLKVIENNLVFSKFVDLVGFRTNVKNITDFESIGLDDSSVKEIRVLAESSMGSELTEDDLSCIKEVAQRAIRLYEYRAELVDYLKKRMEAIAPNLTHLVGEVLGAKLLAQAGGLISLAKQPASTVQILGAEKALFKALKARSNTPKYGLIYHAKLVGQASVKVKGKMSRVLANKISLCARSDACADKSVLEIGLDARNYCERRLVALNEQAAATRLLPQRRPIAHGKTSAYGSYDPDEDISAKRRNTSY